MTENQTNPNVDIRLKEHFKLYIQFKDKINFESKLNDSDINFYYNIDEQPYIDRGIRYFFLDSDNQKVNNIISELEIVTNYESNLVGDFKNDKKIYKLISLLIFGVIGIFLLIAITLKIFK